MKVYCGHEIEIFNILLQRHLGEERIPSGREGLGFIPHEGCSAVHNLGSILNGHQIRG